MREDPARRLSTDREYARRARVGEPFPKDWVVDVVDRLTKTAGRLEYAARWLEVGARHVPTCSIWLRRDHCSCGLEALAGLLGFELPPLERPAGEEGAKRCCDCEKWFPKAAFGPKPIRADGLQPRCRKCRSTRTSLRRLGEEGEGRRVPIRHEAALE